MGAARTRERRRDANVVWRFAALSLARASFEASLSASCCSLRSAAFSAIRRKHDRIYREVAFPEEEQRRRREQEEQRKLQQPGYW